MDASIEEQPLFEEVDGWKSLGCERFRCLGWFPHDVLRPLLTKKEATCDRWGNQPVVIMRPGASSTARMRALSSAGATQALSTTYTEDLYPDSPDQLAHKKRNEIAVTVTGTLLTMKRYKGPKVGFVPWTANDRFRRRRYDPDRLRPLYWSTRAAMQALRPDLA